MTVVLQCSANCALSYRLKARIFLRLGCFLSQQSLVLLLLLLLLSSSSLGLPLVQSAVPSM